MKRLAVYVRRVLLLLAIIVIGVFIGSAIYIRSSAFGIFLKTHIQSSLANTFRGEATLGTVDTSAPGTIAITDFRIRFDGKEIVRIPELRAEYSLVPLLWHQVRIKVSAYRPRFDFARDRNGEWNLLQALALKSSRSQSSGTSAFSVYISRLDVHHGALELSLSPGVRERYRLENVDIFSWLSIDATGLKARISQLSAELRVGSLPPASIRGGLSYRRTDARTLMRIKILRLESGASSLNLAGALQISPDLSSDATISIDRLAAADLDKIVHKYPLRTDVHGRVAVHGPTSAVHLHAELAAGDAQLEATILGDLGRSTPVWNGHLILSGLDLSAIRSQRKIAGKANAELDFQGQAALDMLGTNFKLDAQRLQVGQTRAGNLNLTGQTRNGQARFSGRLAQGTGRVVFDGHALLTGNGKYHLLVAADRLNLAQLTSSSTATNLNSQIVIDGSGYQKTVDATIDFRAIHSIIASVPFEAGLRARIRDGSIELSTATLSSQGSMLSVSGRAKMANDTELQLKYEGRAERLAPWLKLVGENGDGRVQMAGKVSGHLHGDKDVSLSGQGALSLQSIHAYDMSLGGANAKYSFAGLGRTAWPSATIDARFGQLESNASKNIKLSSIAAHILIARGPPSKIRAEIEARDQKQHANRIAADVVLHPNRITGSVDDAMITLADGAWHLQHPAQFAKERDRVSLWGLALVNGERWLTLDAVGGRTGTQNIALHARAIDLSLFESLMPHNGHLSGQVTTDLIVNGTASAPLINGDIEAEALKINSQSAGNIDTRFHYEATKLNLEFICHQDKTHQLELSGQIPLTLGWGKGFAARIGTHEHLRLQTAGIRLAPFAAAANGIVRGAKGMLQANLDLTGSPFHPQVTGDLEVDASGEIVQTGVTVSELKIRVKASPTSIEIAQLSALAGQGSIQGSGLIALHNDYSPGAIEGRIRLEHWPVMATQQYDVRIDGDVHATGTPTAPRITGEIDVVDSTIYPNLAFLSGTSAPPPDPTIVVIEPGEKIPAASGKLPTGTSRAERFDAFKNLAIQLQVNIHRNNWIRHGSTQVELAGNLRIRKRPGGAMSVMGEIDTIRGWIEFMGKRFTLMYGQIIFTGGSQIDPTLHIDGQYLVSEYTVDVIIGGRASKPEIKLQSQPQLAQSDILSLILFGTTSTGLGQGQKTTLQQRAQSIATGAVGQTLVQSLGLESMGVSVSGQSVGIGHYIGQNTFVSVSPNLGANTSSTPSPVASIQYFLARWLSLTTATMSDGSRQIFVNVSKRY